MSICSRRPLVAGAAGRDSVSGTRNSVYLALLVFLIISFSIPSGARDVGAIPLTLARMAKPGPGPGDTSPPIANAGPNQTVDQITIVTFDGTGSTDNVGIVNYTWGIPDRIGPATTHFNLSRGNLMVFDPVRPVLYAIDSSHVDFVNLTTGSLDATFPIAHSAQWPLSLSVSPNGNYLVVGIPTGDRGYYDFGPYLGYVAGFDLANRTEISEFPLAYDIYDVAATDDGAAILSGGSGQWTPLVVVGLRNATFSPGWTPIWQGSPLGLHPGGSRVYSVDGGGISPSAVHRFAFTTAGGITSEQTWPYWGPFPGYNLWVGRDRIVTSNGLVLLSEDNSTGDMTELAQLPVDQVTLAAFDPTVGLIAVVNYGNTLEFFDYYSYRFLGSTVFTTGIQAFAFHGTELEAIAGGQFVTMKLPETFVYGPTPSYRFSDAGTYNVRLTVWDAAGNFGISTVTITVRDTESPRAVAGSNQTVIHGIPVVFDGTGSTDNVGVVSYTWTFNDNGQRILGGSQVNYTFQSPGVFLVTLTVTDLAGNNNRSTTTVTVTRDPVPPIAQAGLAVTIYPGMTVTFDGSASTDNIGVVSFHWTFDDGGPQSLFGVRPSYVFRTRGTFPVTLTVTDLDGNSGSALMTVTVIDVPLETFDHSATYFQIGLPQDWTVRPDHAISGTETVDVFASGGSLGGFLASIFVLSGRESVEESDVYLLSQANVAIGELRTRDMTAVLLQPPHVVSTVNGPAATFEVSLELGQVYEMWAIAVNRVYGRMWVIVGTAHMTDMDTYRAVFLAAILSFRVEPPSWMQQNPLPFGTIATGSGAALGTLVALAFERRRNRAARHRI